MRYFELFDNDFHTDKPGNVYGVLRFDEDSGRIERWNGGKWVYNPSAGDVILGGEPGAREVSKEQVEACIASGKLITIPDDYFTTAGR